MMTKLLIKKVVIYLQLQKINAFCKRIFLLLVVFLLSEDIMCQDTLKNKSISDSIAKQNINYVNLTKYQLNGCLFNKIENIISSCKYYTRKHIVIGIVIRSTTINNKKVIVIYPITYLRRTPALNGIVFIKKTPVYLMDSSSIGELLTSTEDQMYLEFDSLEEEDVATLGNLLDDRIISFETIICNGKEFSLIVERCP